MSQHIDLAGRIAVITGAGSGIGRSSARLIARHGAKVHVADLNGQAAEAVAAEIERAGGRAASHALDVADPVAVEGLADAVFAADGGVDILHNNAGIGHVGNIEATTVEDWQRVINVNLLGVAYGVQSFVPRMLAEGRSGSVINTASMAGLVPTAKMAPYCASKFGVVGLSEALNAELSPRGIHVSAICPGIIDTPIVSTGVFRGDLAALQERAKSFYARRGASPDVVAQAVLQTIARHKLIVPVPRGQVAPLYLLHRVSPSLVQPLARGLERVIDRG
jgi:NAD(P)-dependent dehydrogenase (short-subunit alcohol dehydrogenase family)